MRRRAAAQGFEQDQAQSFEQDRGSRALLRVKVELEEELIDEEDGELPVGGFAAIHAGAGEDYEEETLEGAADLGTMIREMSIDLITRQSFLSSMTRKTRTTTNSTSPKRRWKRTSSSAGEAIAASDIDEVEEEEAAEEEEFADADADGSAALKARPRRSAGQSAQVPA